MVDAGSNHWKPQRYVNATIKIERFERDQALVVIHANIHIGLLSTLGQKTGVRRQRPDDVHSHFLRTFNRWNDDRFFFSFAEQTVFTSMRVEPKHRQRCFTAFNLLDCRMR